MHDSREQTKVDNGAIKVTTCWMCGEIKSVEKIYKGITTTLVSSLPCNCYLEILLKKKYDPEKER